MLKTVTTHISQVQKHMSDITKHTERERRDNTALEHYFSTNSHKKRCFFNIVFRTPTHKTAAKSLVQLIIHPLQLLADQRQTRRCAERSLCGFLKLCFSFARPMDHGPWSQTWDASECLCTCVRKGQCLNPFCGFLRGKVCFKNRRLLLRQHDHFALNSLLSLSDALCNHCQQEGGWRGVRRRRGEPGDFL